MSSSAKETRGACRVCGAAKTILFLRRGQVPVHQNLVLKDEQSARSVSRGNLELVVCEKCGFVSNDAFDFSLLSYGQDYVNDQTYSGAFDDYTTAMARDLVERRGVRDARVIEVGCGNGGFLRKILRDESARNTGIGFDPSYSGPESDLGGRLRFEKRFYDQSCASILADVVVCRHVIEHVPSPLKLLAAIRDALATSPGARVFFETPCVEWIFRGRVLWDLFYEHCSLFSAASLRAAFERSGFRVIGIEHVFGGQYLFAEAVLGASSHDQSPNATRVSELAFGYADAESDLRGDWNARLTNLRADGKVAIWGAGAKGATFANLVDPHRGLIDCLVDLNPRKRGCFVPGTGHPIVSYDQLPARQVTSAILMNPNYYLENKRLLSEHGIALNLIS